MYKIVFKVNPVTQKSEKTMALIESEAEYRNLRNSAENLSVLKETRLAHEAYRLALFEGVGELEVKRLKDEYDKKKSRLLQVNYSCIPSPDGHLKGSTRQSPWVGMDVDFDPADPDFEKKMTEAPARILAMKEKLGLGLLERSVGKGYHVVFRRHAEMSQEDNLRWASELIGCMFDQRAKDITRVFFTTSAFADDLLYLSPQLFLPEANQAVASPGAPQSSAAPEALSAPAATMPAASAEPDPSACSYMGFTMDKIIGKYWELFNDGQTPKEGARESLTYELAVNLRCIVDFSLERLKAIVPRYDNLPEEERLKALTSAANAERRGMTYRMRKVLDALKQEQKAMPWGMTQSAPPIFTGRLPEPLAKLADIVPDGLKTTVSEGSFGALNTHLHDVTFRLTDGTEVEPAIMQILINRQSSGKSCIDRPIECINEDLMENDIEAREREQKYKQENPTGKKKKPRPQDIYIQICQSDMTNAAFVQRLIDAHRNGHRPLFTQMQELDEITALSANGKSGVSLIIRKAFDRKAYGQERVGCDSITGVAPLRWNFTAATTPVRARQLCTPWVGDGTLTRCNLLTIDPQDTPGRPHYKPVTQQYKDSIKPYIKRLNEAQGLILCPKAEKLIKRLEQLTDDAIAATDSQALTTFASRALTIAYFKAMIIYIMQGRWSRDIEAYVEWSLRRDLWVKLHYFGQKMEDDIETEQNMQTYHPRDVLQALGNPFSEDEFCQKRRELGLRGDYKEHLKKLRQRKKIYFDDTIRMYVKNVA